MVIDILMVICLVVFSTSSDTTEIVYSKGIYPVFAFIWGRITDITRVSISELLLVSFVLIVLIRLIIGIYRIVVGKRTFKNTLLHFLKQLFIVASIVITWFYTMWGFNYFREIGHQRWSIIDKDVKISDELVEKTTNQLIERVNDLYMETIGRRSVRFDQLEVEIDNAVYNTVNKLDNIEIRPAVKSKVSIANILENSSFLGVISPFTIESHVSKELFKQEVPFIVAHEKAHLYGYANETEANYIAFIACMESDNKSFKYSAMSQILRYFLGQYRRAHTEKEYNEIWSKIDNGIRNEYREQRQRNNKYQNIVTDSLYKIYNLYLKINKVPGGTISYSGVAKWIMQTKNLDDYLQDNEEYSDSSDDLIIDDRIFEHFGVDDPIDLDNPIDNR